jgi:surfactin synthase thioesterase subunit
MYCFHPAGGAASLYRGWSAKCPGGFATSALQLPGREARMREAPHRTMQAAVKEIVDAMADETGRPACFFGYSMGALVAYETILEMQRRRLPLPRRLIVAAMSAPHVPEMRKSTGSNLTDDEILEEVRLSGTGPEFVLREREVMKAVLPMIRADFEILESYVPTDDELLTIPIVAYGGLGDPLINPAGVAAWCTETSADFRARFFPGDHYFLKVSGDAMFQDMTTELRTLAA